MHNMHKGRHIQKYVFFSGRTTNRRGGWVNLLNLLEEKTFLFHQRKKYRKKYEPLSQG